MVCCCLFPTPLFKMKASTARFLYLFGFLVSAVASWALRDYGARALRFVPAVSEGCGAGAGGAAALSPTSLSAAASLCLGKSAVLRVAFASTVYFLAHALALLCVTTTGDPRLILHTGCPPLQVALWAALAGSAFAFPAPAVSGFGHAARVFAGLYLLLQALILLEFLFAANSYLVERSEEGSTLAAAVLVAGSFLLYVGAFVGLVFLFAFWAPKASCSLSTLVLAWTLVVSFIVSTFVSLTPCRQKAAGLFTSAAMAAYSTYLAWSALASLPPNYNCTPRESLLLSNSSSSIDGTKATKTNGSVLALRIASFVVTVLALCYATFSASASHSAISTSAAGSASAAAAAAAEAGRAGKKDGKKDDDDEDGEEDKPLSYRPDFFHATFALAACYLAMIFVSWEWKAVSSSSSRSRASNPEEMLLILDRSMASFGVKFASLILSQLLYLLALLAPVLFPGREFE